MNRNTTLSVDLTKEEDISQITSNHSFVNVYDPKLIGKGLVHLCHPGCEYKQA